MTQQKNQSRWGTHVMTVSLFGMVILTALGVVFSTHTGRQLFTQLQSAQQEIEALQLEWSQLLLEQGTWSANTRIVRLARQELQMILPEPSEVVIIRKKKK